MAETTNLGKWLRRHKMTCYGAAALWNLSPETVRRWCLPRRHPLARRPRRVNLAMLYVETGLPPSAFDDLPIATRRRK